MKRSGYLKKTGFIAYDSDGIPHRVIELYIRRERYAVRLTDLVSAIAGRVCVQVESLSHNWKYYLGTVAGLAQVSVSGKALNIDLFSAGSFTVSLTALRAVIFGRDQYAMIVEIPDSLPQARFRRIGSDQQHLGVTA